MIEGIIGLFVILFLILVVPPTTKIAKRWWEIYNEPVEVTFVDESTGSFDRFVYAEPSDMPPSNPVFGQTWMNTQNKTAYMWNGDVWSPYHTPKEGDVWFW